MGKVMKLFVGYRTRLRDSVAAEALTFKAPTSYTDPAKIAEYVENKRRTFLENAKNIPYTGMLDEICIIDPNGVNDKRPDEVRIKSLMYKTPTDPNKASAAVRARNYLVKTYPEAWHNNLGAYKDPSVMFVGFAPQSFLWLLGLECSLPAVNKPCPLSLWCGGHCCDIAALAYPPDCHGLSLAYVLKQRRPLDEADGPIWDELTKEWNGPGNNPEQDAKIAIELATQLGFLND